MFVKIFTLLFPFESLKIILSYSLTSFELKQLQSQTCQNRSVSSGLLRYRLLNPSNRLKAQSSDH